MFLFILWSDGGQTVVAEIDHQVNKQTISVILQQLISSIELMSGTKIDSEPRLTVTFF